MSKQFTPCPACGAVGEVNSTCQFCGTTILLKEGATPSNARIIKQRTVTPQQYAERISIYEDVRAYEESHYLRRVRIGNEQGVINLNGELVYPLQHVSIHIVSDTKLYLSGGEGARNILVKNKDFEEDIDSSPFEYVRLGVFLDLKTMEKYDGIQYTYDDDDDDDDDDDNDGRDVWYAWENNLCKGRIDPRTWEIIEPADEDVRAYEESEREKWIEEKRLKLKEKRLTAELIEKRRKESEKRAEEMRVKNRRDWVIGIIFTILFILFSYFF